MQLRLTENNLKTPLIFFVAVLANLAIGIAMVYSASTIESFVTHGSTNYYFLHQLLYGVLPGLALLLVASQVDYHYYQKLVIPFMLLGLALLVMVKIPFFSFSYGGATRWIHVGPLVFQPAELAKFVVILYTSSWISNRQKEIFNFATGLMPFLFVLGLVTGLILWQPDLGTVLAIGSTALVILFVGGVRLKYFFYILLMALGLVLLVIRLEPYRMARLLTFINPQSDPQGAGYQINQATLAIGSGGPWGFGYGLSRQKHSYLPEVMGDSIFAVIAEEMGFFRIVGFIAIYLSMIVTGFITALKSIDHFGKLLAVGILASISIQAFLNVGAISGIVPLTGLPLPLISYGSSSMITTLFMLGVAMNIFKQAK